MFYKAYVGRLAATTMILDEGVKYQMPSHFPFNFEHVVAVHFQTQNSDFSEAYFKGVSWFEKQE